MQVTFNTDSPSDCAFARLILGMAAPAPVAPVAPVAPTPSPGQAGMPPLPAGAQAGAHWASMPGAPQLQDASGHPIYVDWTPGGPVLRAE